MKKLLVILAAALMVMAVAVSCGGNKNENKAEELAEKQINAAKAGDVAAFAEAIMAMEEFAKGLSEEEAKELGNKLNEKFGQDAIELVEEFSSEHWREIRDYKENAQKHEEVEEEYAYAGSSDDFDFGDEDEW